MKIPEKLAILTMPNFVMFPGSDLPLKINEPRHRLMITDVLKQDKILGIAMIRDNWQDGHTAAPSLYSVGTAAAVTSFHHDNNKTIHLFLKGVSKIFLGADVKFNPYRIVEVTPAPNDIEVDEQNSEIRDLRNGLMNMMHQAHLQGVIGPFPVGTLDRLPHTTTPNFISLAVRLLSIAGESQQNMLECDGPINRLRLLIDVFQHDLLYQATLGEGTSGGENGFTH